MKPIPTETGTDVGNVGKWLGAAAAGALLMYLLDPERGGARRSRAASALRTAGARTGATVDHALHSAGDRLAGLKDSAAGVLSRGAGRLQAQTAPMLERARHGAQEATQRLEDSAERVRARARAASREHAWDNAKESARESTWNGAGARSHASDTGSSPARYKSYERHDSGYDSGYDSRSYQPDRQYGAGSRGGLAGWLRGLTGFGSRTADREDAGTHPALLGGGMLGLLSLMRRSPGGLLVGLAGLALLMQATRDRTYRVTDNMPTGMGSDTHDNMRSSMGGKVAGNLGSNTGRTQDSDERAQAPLASPGEQAGSRYLH